MKRVTTTHTRASSCRYNDGLKDGQLATVGDPATWKAKHDQFCFLVTEEPLTRFQPVFQNDGFLVLYVPT